MEIKLRIQNFKNIDDIEFELKPITLLFGENGAGKSNILKAVQFFFNNAFPLNLEKVNYKIDENTDLISFENIVNKDSKSEEIIFTLSHSKKVPLPNRIIFEEDFEIIYEYILSNSPDFEKKIEAAIPNILSRYGGEKNFSTIKQFVQWYVYQFKYNFLIDYYQTYFFSEFEFIPANGFEEELFEYFYCLLEETELNYSMKFIYAKGFDDADLKSITITDNISGNNFTYTLDISEVSRIYEEISSSDFTFDLNINNQNFNQKARTFNYYAFIRPGSTDDKIFSFKEFGYKIFKLDSILSPGLNRNSPYIRFDLFFEKYGYEIYGINENSWNNFSMVDKFNKYFDFITFWFFSIKYLYEFFKNYCEAKLFPAIREIPQHKYLLNNNVFSKEAYYTLPNNIINLFDEKSLQKSEREHYLIEKDEKNGYKDYVLNKDILKLNYFGLNLNFRVRIDHGIGYLLTENLNTNKLVNLRDEFSGLQQILPILIQIYLSKNYSRAYPSIKFFIIQQPELHLHPKFQSNLATVFTDSVKENFTSLIETHSEHIIKKFQILVAKGELDRSKLNILYIDSKNGKMNCKKMILDDNGFFTEPWPDGFFDESMNLNIELLTIRKN